MYPVSEAGYIDIYPLLLDGACTDKANHGCRRVGQAMDIADQLRRLDIEERPKLLRSLLDQQPVIVSVLRHCVLPYQDAVSNFQPGISLGDGFHREGDDDILRKGGGCGEDDIGRGGCGPALGSLIGGVGCLECVIDSYPGGTQFCIVLPGLLVVVAVVMRIAGGIVCIHINDKIGWLLPVQAIDWRRLFAGNGFG